MPKQGLAFTVQVGFMVLKNIIHEEGNKMEDYLQVGVIANTHGVRGEVKVFPTTDDPARFKKLKTVILDTGKGQLGLEITQVKFFKNMVILKFRDFDNINDVEPYKGKGLFVTREQAVARGEDEYFIADLIGMEVMADGGQPLGDIVDVIKTGANDVYVVQVREDSPYAPKVAGKKKELLLPAIKDCILDVDLEQKKMQVHVMPGLLEEG